MIRFPDEEIDPQDDIAAVEECVPASSDYLPARMINEAVYCPRLFYLMHVEGQFARNAETADGSNVHKRVDAKVDPLQTAKKTSKKTAKSSPSSLQLDLFNVASETTEQRDMRNESIEPQADPFGNSTPDAAVEVESLPPSEPDRIHARSVTLASDVLGVIAKLDLVEGSGQLVTPVDYKRGSPKKGRDGTLTAWKPEQIQVCLQALVLRENGFECNAAIIYFNETRQRIEIPIDDTLIEETKRYVAQAKKWSELTVPPPPLLDSPKCPKCSLSAICLPDETNRCRASEGKGPATKDVRLPSTPRDDLRPVYLNTQGLHVGKTSEALVVKEGGREVQQIRLREINQVNVFGNVQISTQALQTMCEMEIPLVFHSQHGYFHGMVQGTGLKNILLRREQFRLADRADACLEIAKQLIIGKIRNQRVLLMRNHVSPPTDAIAELKRIVHRVERVKTAASLLGVEGNAARIYFQQFSGMIKPGDDPIDPGYAFGEAPRYTFDFRTRNRRPPRDPVNALLSYSYALLAKDLAVIAASVGFDPYLGFYHLPRPGRPALALDLMEPFRPLIAESVVITAINNRMVYPEHFIPAGKGVTMTESGRKALFRAYEQRMDQLVTHPLFDYRVSYRRLLEIQTRLLARVVTGELGKYPVFVTR